LDRSEDSLEFAGASIDLYVIDQKGRTTRHRGARMTLGYELHDQPLAIDSVSLRVGSNSFVMTTDGLLKQVGEATGRVLGTRRFETALGEVGCNAPSKLIRAIALLLKNWQGREECRDDISFIAFKPIEF
jgi:serine phosphatase RsbU (regulator of sigma subunit)